MMAGRHADAERWLRRALAVDPDNVAAKLNYAGAIVWGTGDDARALDAVQGDAPRLKSARAWLLVYQRKYGEAIALVESIPDTADNFSAVSTSKTLQLADLHRLAGRPDRARPLFAAALPKARAQLAGQRDLELAAVWQAVADAELGLGHTNAGLDAIARAEAILARSRDRMAVPGAMARDAGLYAQANRPDLAVPLLVRALTAPGIGVSYAPALLWLDPAWDPIRDDKRFQTLLKQYVKFKPAVIAAAPQL